MVGRLARSVQEAFFLIVAGLGTAGFMGTIWCGGIDLFATMIFVIAVFVVAIITLCFSTFAGMLAGAIMAAIILTACAPFILMSMQGGWHRRRWFR